MEGVQIVMDLVGQEKDGLGKGRHVTCHRLSFNKRLQKPTLGCLFEPLMRKWFNFFETVSSIHLNLQFQLRSVREVCKDFNIMSSSLSADRVKSNQRLLGANS